MKYLQPPQPEIWQGRQSSGNQYLHEQISFLDMEDEALSQKKGFTIMGYACDEGVRRNQGRVGAVNGPIAIKKELAKLPCPLNWKSQLYDAGNVKCTDQDMEGAQATLSKVVKKILNAGLFPIVVGGGHDVAFGHYSGIRSYLGPDATLGIINLDAHFDLRNNSRGNNSGTPFYQIAQELKEQDLPFHYFCLGIREEANSNELFETAKEFGASYILNSDFHPGNKTILKEKLTTFLKKVDQVYLTIDLDGFSSAYAPGVSAASPFGYDPLIALWTLQIIIASGKLISLDIAELNPQYDQDSQTAKLAAGLVHHVLGNVDLI